MRKEAKPDEAVSQSPIQPAPGGVAVMKPVRASLTKFPPRIPASPAAARESIRTSNIQIQTIFCSASPVREKGDRPLCARGRIRGVPCSSPASPASVHAIVITGGAKGSTKTAPPLSESPSCSPASYVDGRARIRGPPRGCGDNCSQNFRSVALSRSSMEGRTGHNHHVPPRFQKSSCSFP
jgi:hypothetical protein